MAEADNKMKRVAIAFDLSEGMSTARAAKKYGVTSQTVVNCARSYKSFTSPYLRRKLMAMQVKAGTDPKEVAKRFSRTLETVGLACADHGVLMPQVSQVNVGSTSFEVLASILKTKELNLAAIGEYHRVSRQYVSAVYNKAKRAGIKVPKL